MPLVGANMSLAKDKERTARVRTRTMGKVGDPPFIVMLGQMLGSRAVERVMK